MRLVEIEDPSSDKVATVAKSILTRCSDIVNFYRTIPRSPGDFFMRGTSAHIKNPGFFGAVDYYRSRSNPDRSPKDVSLNVHNKIVEWMVDMKFAAHRGNSIFVTSDSKEAHEMYGRLFIIFPVNGFSYTWSKMHKDFFKSIEHSKDVREQILELDMDSIQDIRWFDNFFQFQNHNLEQAFQSKNEVMINGEYYAINSSHTDFVENSIIGVNK